MTRMYILHYYFLLLPSDLLFISICLKYIEHVLFISKSSITSSSYTCEVIRSVPIRRTCTFLSMTFLLCDPLRAQYSGHCFDIGDGATRPIGIYNFMTKRWNFHFRWPLDSSRNDSRLLDPFHASWWENLPWSIKIQPWQLPARESCSQTSLCLHSFQRWTQKLYRTEVRHVRNENAVVFYPKKLRTSRHWRYSYPFGSGYSQTREWNSDSNYSTVSLI